MSFRGRVDLNRVREALSQTETVISREELAKLGEYSCTLPTGTTIGKRWRRNVNAFKSVLPSGQQNPHGPRQRLEPEWMIGEYYDIGSEIGVRFTWAVSEPGQVHRGKLP